ncbi:MAG: hypothetical protein Q8S73_18825 [Deltaproteobacteria bacterium]|nr:hypothetical protein [Myxococcales bacterium]MDP3216169.1 hypothetical protein [Deltaproteobacteria bacterium]
MKITLDSIDGRQFTLRLPRDGDAREHLIALHTTRRLRGVYAHDAAAIRLDPVEADEIVGELAWMLDGGSVRLGGPARLGATRLDLDLARGSQEPAATGDARWESLSAPVTGLTLGDLDVLGALELGALHARHDRPTNLWSLLVANADVRSLDVARPGLHARLGQLSASAIEAQLGVDSLRLSAVSAHARALSLDLGAMKLTAASAAVTGLRLSREAGSLVVEADELTLTGVELVDPPRAGRSDELRVTALRYGPDGLSFDRLECPSLTFALEGLGAPADPAAPSPAQPPPEEGTTRRLGVDLPFLDLLEGHLAADTRVDVRLPVIHRRTATHTARLAITAGAIDFKELEHGLSLLEDAILDFELEDSALVLELDAVLTKKKLLAWPLDAAGVARARRGHVALRTLLQPEVTAGAPDEDEGDGELEPRVALRRVEVTGLLLEARLRGATTMPLAGGVLRLGAEDVSALASLRLRGSLVHEAAPPGETTELAVELAGLDLGADALTLGGRQLDLRGLSLGGLTDGVLTLHGPRPVAARGALRDLSLRSLRWAAAPAR